MEYIEMIEEFKSWFNELGAAAKKRKDDIELKTGKRPAWNNKVKNKEIKEKFTNQVSHIESIKPRSSSDRKAREWMYDLIWREHDSNNHFSGVKLAMEIELSEMKVGGLIYDYNKLLQSDSVYKVFVFQQKTKVDMNVIFDELELRTNSYNHRAESEFLLSCWCWETGTFIFKDLHVKQ
jgi:hypothetical protein